MSALEQYHSISVIPQNLKRSIIRYFPGFICGKISDDQIPGGVWHRHDRAQCVDGQRVLFECAFADVRNITNRAVCGKIFFGIDESLFEHRDFVEASTSDVSDAVSKLADQK